MANQPVRKRLARVRGYFSVSAGRDPYIETLRGLACIMLVLYHVIGADPFEGLKLPPDSPWRYVADTLAYVRMPLFSLLSGYVYAYRPVTSGTALGPFIRGKARRLLIPMLVIGTVFGLVQTYLPGSNNPIQLPWYLWHIKPIGPYWFLEAMMWVFIVIAALEKAGVLKRLEIALPILVLTILVDGLLPDATNWLGWRTGLYLLPFFLAGLIASRFDWKSWPRGYHIAVLSVAILLTLVTQLGILGVIERVPVRHSITASVLGVGACWVLLLIKRQSKFLVFIGSFSFTIYTCQVFGAVAMRILLARLNITDETVNVVAGVFAGIVFSILVEVFARRSRVTAFLLLGRKWGKPPERSGRSD